MGRKNSKRAQARRAFKSRWWLGDFRTRYTLLVRGPESAIHLLDFPPDPPRMLNQELRGSLRITLCGVSLRISPYHGRTTQEWPLDHGVCHSCIGQATATDGTNRK